MSLGKFYKNVWNDEVLRENNISQRDVKLVVDAVARTIIKLITEKGEVNWHNLFTIKSVNVRGWKNKSIHDGSEHKIDDFKRVYIKPSKRLKDSINSNKWH